MAAPTKNNGAQAQASKKKKGKGDRRTDSPAPSTASAAPAKPVSANPSEGHDNENPYLRELAKNVRNLTKKITNVTKTESLIAGNEGKSLDELVAAKIINNDQKAQILNKPSLERKLSEAEAELGRYKKMHTEYQEQRAADKKHLEETLGEQAKKKLEEAVAKTEAEVKAKAEKELRERLLTISQFLAVAAARRGEDFDPEEDENQALEGCLLQVYHGNDSGVDAMLKISSGADEKTTAVSGENLTTTYAKVKEISATYAAALYPPVTEASAPEEQPAAEEPASEEPAAEEAAPASSDTPKPSDATPVTDPTIANASFSEIDADTDVAVPTAGNGTTEEVTPAPNGAPANASVADEAANAAGESQWDSPTNDPTMSQSWVQVPRDPAQTETGLESTPAAAANVQSWSDEVADHHEPQAETSQPPTQESTDDGFTAVQRRNPRDSRDDRHRGRGRGGRGRGEYRGRGGRGEYRGRGRGGMGGGRRPDASANA